MKLTKYEHACFTVEIDGRILIVDPGSLTKNLGVPENVVAIVITHEHSDHFNPDILATLYGKNPDSILISLQSIIDTLPDHPSKAVSPGDTVTIGAFDLEFFGGDHALIHSTVPVIENIGVMINRSLYYPGDSFALPGKPITTLALPTAAPWLKMSEVIDFAVAAKPKLVFPTHDALLSDIGKHMSDSMIPRFLLSTGIVYERIDGKTITI